MPLHWSQFRALGLITLLASTQARAASSWTGLAGDGKWHTSGNWNGIVPDSSVDATFPVSGTYGVALNSNAAARSLTISNGSPAFNLSGYKLAVDGEIAVTGGFSTPANLSLTGGAATSSSAFVGRSNNSGTLTLTGNTTSLTVGTGSLFAGYSRGTLGAPQGNLSLTTGATLTANGFYLGYFGGTNQTTVNAANLVTGASGTINVGSTRYATVGDTTGTLTVSNAGTITSTASITTAVIGASGATGAVSLQGTGTAWTHRGNIYVGGASASALGTGTLDINSGASLGITNSTVSSLRVFNGGGTLKLSGAGSKLSVESIDLDGNAANFQFTGGTLEMTNTSLTNFGTASLGIGGTMNGTGTVNGKASVTSTGTISPGTSTTPGTIYVTGNLLSSGKIDMRVYNVNSSGKLIIGGTPTLNGTVAVTLANGYSPAIGASFDLLDFTGPLGGTYAFDFSAAPLGPGKAWDTSAFATSGVVTVGTPEPGVLFLTFLAGLPLLTRRRRRA
jgi:T5SS/PEP-CTERM-associated repeat protein